MPVNADSDLDICNRGLILIGADTISSFTDTNVEATVANAMYEDTVRNALTSHRWRFATQQVALTANATAPVSRWDTAYDLPFDALVVNAVTVNDYPIEYDIYGKQIYCNATSTDTVVLDYTERAIEVDWPPYFVMAMAYAMAQVFALSIARDEGMASIMENRSEVLFMKARHKDSQQQTTKKLFTSRFITQRRS
jgi:hypothetical protein